MTVFSMLLKYYKAHLTSLSITQRDWLRLCAANRKVAISFPVGVIGIFHSHNPSCLTMALGLTEPLTEMSMAFITWG